MIIKMLIPSHRLLEFGGSFIPFPYLQVFHRGAYFATEVVPGKVAVISLNTMYFYDSNKGQFG
jgi:endopolyphosphatase